MRLNSDRPISATFALLRNAQESLKRKNVPPPLSQRAAVPATGVADLDGVIAADGLLPLFAEQFVLARMSNAIEVPPRVRLVNPLGAAASIVAEKAAAPIARITIDLAGLTVFAKAVGIVVQSNEAVFRGGDVVARGLQQALVRATVDVMNLTVFSSEDATADAPAGLGFGATVVEMQTGDLAENVRSLVASMGNDVDPASLVFVTDFQTAARLGTEIDVAGALLFPNVGVTGGELLNIPLLVTKASPLDGSPGEGSLFLVDSSAISYAIESVGWGVSQNAMVELSDEPTGDGHAPATASQQLVSLFQNDLTAFKSVMRASWKKTRADAVSVLTGI